MIQLVWLKMRSKTGQTELFELIVEPLEKPEEV